MPDEHEDYTTLVEYNAAPSTPFLRIHQPQLELLKELDRVAQRLICHHQPNMKGDYRVCQVCLGHIRRARLPPMSSTSTPTPSTRQTPRPNPQADGGSAFGSSGVTNYFFGFLFLFAVILLILIGCGIGTRRRFLSRRGNSLASLEPWASPGLGGEIAPPEFHESRFVAASAAGWKNVMPFSAAYFADEHDLNEKSASDDVDLGHSPVGQTTSYQPVTSGSNYPNFTRTFLSTLRKPPSNPQAAARPVNAIRVAILVAMPSPRDPGTGAQHFTTATASSSEMNLLKKAPEEFQIGVETLPWRKR